MKRAQKGAKKQKALQKGAIKMMALPKPPCVNKWARYQIGKHLGLKPVHIRPIIGDNRAHLAPTFTLLFIGFNQDFGNGGQCGRDTRLVSI